MCYAGYAKLYGVCVPCNDGVSRDPGVENSHILDRFLSDKYILYFSINSEVILAIIIKRY